jgi:histone deacetylase 11
LARREGQRRIDCAVPLYTNCHGADYLDALRKKLPPFLDAIAQNGRIGLAVYNAGTDIVAGDPLGRMNVSEAHVLERDRFVIDQLTRNRIPTVVVPSGGYTRESYRLITNMVEYILTAFPGGIDAPNN